MSKAWGEREKRGTDGPRALFHKETAAGAETGPGTEGRPEEDQFYGGRNEVVDVKGEKMDTGTGRKNRGVLFFGEVVRLEVVVVLQSHHLIYY